MTRLKDEIDVGEIPPKIEFYFGRKNYNFFLMCPPLDLNKNNESVVDFLLLGTDLQIFRENALLVHIETGNIFYNNYNTNELMYSFSLNPQDKTKKVIHAT